MATTWLSGYGHPLDYNSGKKDPGFICPLLWNTLREEDISGAAFDLLSLCELTMLQLMIVATDELDWNTKKKWKEELSSEQDFIPKMVFRWTQIQCISYSAQCSYSSYQMYSNLTMPSLPNKKKILQANVAKFESKIPAKLKDWHPGSDQKVWDLVHPSLFSLVYGRTRILSSETTTLEDWISNDVVKEKLQAFLPMKKQKRVVLAPNFNGFLLKWTYLEIKQSMFISPRGQQTSFNNPCGITSYINNLHPQKEKSLYEIVSQLTTASIPLWELTLAPLVQGNNFSRSMRIAYTEVEYDPDPEAWGRARDRRRTSNWPLKNLNMMEVHGMLKVNW